MGNWKIEIEGHGIHDNALPDDADQIAQECVARLKARGHDIARARFALDDGGRDLGVATLFPILQPASETSTMGGSSASTTETGTSSATNSESNGHTS